MPISYVINLPEISRKRDEITLIYGSAVLPLPRPFTDTVLKTITQFNIWFLAMLMLLKAFIVPIVYVDFKIHQDYIAEVLCINRDKPELHCNGKCILMQKIKEVQETGDQDKNQTFQRYLMEIICDESFGFDFNVFPVLATPFFTYQENALSHYLPNTFHPPQITQA